MELRQLNSLIALAENGFSVSRAAQKLHLVQPAVSQHLKQLEQELGTRLFRRNGKRLTGLTESGERVLHYARNIITDTSNILAVGQEHVSEEKGVLRIGTTHTQARYVLPPIVRHFSEAYPAVELQMLEGTPRELVDMAKENKVDFAICTEALGEHPALLAIPCNRWNRCLIAPKAHPVLAQKRVTLKALCRYPIITYVAGFTGRDHLTETFGKEDLNPHVVLSATDTDVIKTYVREGMGIGIIADLAYEREKDTDLAMRDLSHLFPWEVTKIGYRRDKYLRTYQQRFIDFFQEISGRMGQAAG
ncbi:MAG: LysR family transcriptional regulator [Candidatus Thiodiazotropha sp. (ex Myrtea sp. 'scaly one' KF741663)]|nr:LysR family transcriptional regulator [Candidatus Thiodiazotropha sp. (ex Myrtea sp. 'scaly one' KF741663)]